MCGRFSQTHSAEEIAAAFALEEIPQWQPRYNLAPTQTVQPSSPQTITVTSNPFGGD